MTIVPLLLICFQSPETIEQVNQISRANLAGRYALVQDIWQGKGEAALAEFIPFLKQKENPQQREAAIYVLSRFDRAATFALIACLDAPDELLRRGILQALQHRDDVRALPALQEVRMNDADALSRNAAAAAIQRIAPWAQSMSGADLYVMLGDALLRRDPEVITEDAARDFYWSYEPEQGLSQIPVPQEIYIDELAKQAFARALKYDPLSMPAREGLALALGEQWKKLDGSSDSPYVLAAHVGLATLGVETQDPSNQLFSTIKEAGYQGSSEAQQASFLALLAQIQFAAGQTIHLIDGQDLRRQSLAQKLSEEGYLVLATADVVSGLLALRQGPPAHLILLGDDFHTLSLAQVQLEIQRDRRLATVPLRLLSVEQEISLDEIIQAIGEQTNQVALAKAAIYQLLNMQLDEQERLQALSVLSAAARQRTYPQLSELALVSLAEMGTQEELSGLADILLDQRRPASVRILTANAIGQILARVQTLTPTFITDALYLTIMAAEEADVKLAAAHAVGRAHHLSPQAVIKTIAEVQLNL